MKTDITAAFADIERSMNLVSLHEKTLAVIITLGVEYEAQTITAERFANQVLVNLRTWAEGVKKCAP